MTDILDIGDRISQWGSILDRKRNELQNYFPSPNSAYAGAVPSQPTDISTKSTGGNKTVNKSGNTRFPKQTSTTTTTTGTQATLPVPTVERGTPEIVG